MTEHEVGFWFPESVQLAAGLKVPLPVVVKVTVPEGGDVFPAAVSVTVAVQVLPAPAFTGEAQESPVVVLRRLTASANVPELAECVVPVGLKVPVIVCVEPPLVAVGV